MNERSERILPAINASINLATGEVNVALVDSRTLNRIIFEECLKRVTAHKGNKSLAARSLGIGRSTLFRYLRADV